VEIVGPWVDPNKKESRIN